jgi:hypothetical protein
MPAARDFTRRPGERPYFTTLVRKEDGGEWETPPSVLDFARTP